RHTMGPDEYHQCVDDSAYVNAMAQFNLKFGIESALWLKRWHPSTWKSLGIKDEELEDWCIVASDLVDGYYPETRSIEEFAGYFKLEDLNSSDHQSMAKTQIIKQADVVLLCYLLQDRFDLDVIKRNFEYYEPRCDHASSLSPSIHAL